MESLAGFPIVAPALPRPVTFDQFWGDLTFVHWPVQPYMVAHLFPLGRRRRHLAQARPGART